MTAAPAATRRRLHVHVLGTRGRIRSSARRYARHAGVLVDGGILLDVGDPAYLRHRPDAIFISHLHPDHAAFPAGRGAPDADVYVPQAARTLPWARVMAGPVDVAGCRVVPVPTVHSHVVRSLGFVVEKGGRRLFYSSDLVTILPRYRARLGWLDLVITDGSFMRRGGLVRTDPASGRRFGHAGIPELVELFGAFTERIVVAHFGSWFYRDVPAARRKIAALGDGVRVSAAFDGMTIDL